MRYIFWTFVALIVLAPLPFGMVYGLHQALFAFCFLGLAAAYCAIRVRSDQGLHVPMKKIWPEMLGFFLVLGWGAAQLVSFTPETWHHPLWAEAAMALGIDVKGSVTLARGAGFEAIMRLVAYGAVFFLALQLGRDRRRASLFLWTVLLAGTGYAVYGLIMHFSGLDMILWAEVPGASKNVSATFVNRNNFATYAGLALICAAGLYLDGFFQSLRSGRTGRDRKLHIMQYVFVRGAPLLACMLVLFTALFLSNSRAGVTCTLVALLVLAVFLALFIKIKSRIYSLALLTVLAAAIGVFLTSGDTWLDRLMNTEIEREPRLERYQQTWDAIQIAPWTGYGIGSFAQTFPMFASERTSSTREAHNDWLEMTFDLGIPAALVWFAVLGCLGVRCLAGFFLRERDQVYTAVGVSACFLVGLHSLVDFSLQIPAVAVTFAVLLGVGVAQSRSSLEKDYVDTL